TSRQLCFITFPSIDESRDFLEANFPHIYLYGSSASDADESGSKVRIAYSREREDRHRGKVEGEWLCSNCDIVNYATRTKCFRCQASRAEYSAPPPEAAAKPRNHGDSDVAPDGVPSQFLLLRGLDSSVTEELLAKGVAKLYKPSSTDAHGANAKKGAKVVSTTGNSNTGARESSIRRVLLVRDRKSNDSWGYGFAEFATVEDAQAALNRHNSFETFTISSKPVLASYIHAGVFVPVLNSTASTERFTFSPLANPAMKLAYWDQDAYVTELSVSEEPIASATTEKFKTRGSEKPKKRKIADGVSALAPKKTAMSSHLQFWSERHAELHGIQRATVSEDGIARAGSEGAMSGASGADAPVVPSKSYSDLTRNCCYLCMRQFKSSADVNRHERLSDLHRKNLQDAALISRAEHKLSKQRDVDHQSSTEYRDRAKERRQVFGSSKPKPAKAGPAKSRSPEPTPQPAMSKGASLLGKMGWSAGTGLGAQGTGVTAPVAQDLYVQGVGLGAQGGKIKDAVQEAERRTTGKYDDFLEKTKEQAKQRYEAMMREQP
ncbi:hypothetical protein KEM56_006417, partial [Ascosphaera pollenicola]